MRYGTNSSALRQNIRNRHSTLVACKHTVSGSFHSPSGVLFAFPSRYWFTIGQMRVFSLATWSWQFHAEFHVLRGTQDTASSSDFFAYGTITLYCRSFQRHSAKIRFFYSTYAVLQPRRASTTVWALPISLATTFGISVDFFSSGY